MKRILLVSLSLWMVGSLWAADGWLEDVAAAKKASLASGKPILVDITGSDWCPPCQRMEAEVFAQSNFLPQASARYVLLRLDFPRNTPQTEKIRVQNQKWSEEHPFEGFPTFVLMDGQGLVYGQTTGYIAGGVKAFLEMTKVLETQKATMTTLLETLKKAPAGVARAQAQDALYRQAEAWGLEATYADLPFKIVQEDSDGKAGLKPRYQVLNTYNRMIATWTETSDYRKVAADLASLGSKAETWPDLKQRIVFTEGMVWLNAVGDEKKAKETLSRARALAPSTSWGQRAADLLDQLP